MKIIKEKLAILLSICMVFGCIILPGVFANTEPEIHTGIKVADSAHRSDYDPAPTNISYWNNYWVSGGSSVYWLWKTTSSDTAIFRYNLPDTASSFEPYFEGEDTAQSFKIYGSNNNQDWYVVAEMNDAYTKNQVYNSTIGVSDAGYAQGSKATAGNSFSSLNSANITLLLQNNPSKVVYLKIGDLAADSEIQIRSLGLTYNYTGDDVPGTDNNAETGTAGIKVADSANRTDFSPLISKSDYFNNYYVSGGAADGSKPWLWVTSSVNTAIYKFDLPDGAISFEPYFEGEDTAQSFKIYASATQSTWYPVAEMTEVYEKNEIYNSTTGLGTGDYAKGDKLTAGRAFSAVNEANIAEVLNNNTSKTVYLKIGDISSPLQIRALGITYRYTGDDNSETPVIEDKTFSDPHDGDNKYELKTEYRIAVEGQTFDEGQDGFKTYGEDKFALGDLGGEIKSGNRVLKGVQSVVFRFEVDPDAVFLKLDGWDASEVEGLDGSALFNISFYSEEAEEFQGVADCGTENGALMPPRLTWNKFDNTWGRSANNEYIVTNAPINAETGKKIVTVKLTGQFNKSYDGQLFYKSFLVQTVVPVTDDNNNSSSNSSNNSSTPVNTGNNNDQKTPNTGDAILLTVILIALSLSAAFVINRKRRIHM